MNGEFLAQRRGDAEEKRGTLGPADPKAEIPLRLRVSARGSRGTLLRLCLVGMDLTWLLAWMGLLLGTRLRPGLAVPWPVVLGALLLAWLACLALRSSRLSVGAQQALAAAGAVASAAVLVRLVAGIDFASLQDVGSLWLSGNGPRGLLLIALALYAWGRGIWLAQARLSAEAVGLSLRWGIVAWLWFGLAALLTHDVAPAGLVLAFFGLGLTAQGLARVEEVYGERGAVRSPYGLSWVLILLSGALLTVGAGVGLTFVVTPGLAAAVWGIVGPVLAWTLGRIAQVAFWLLTPLMNWLMKLLKPATERALEQVTLVPQPTPQPEVVTRGLPAPVQGILWAAAGLAFLAIVWLIVTGLGRSHRKAEETAERSAEWEREHGPRGAGLGKRLGDLKDRLLSALSGRRRPELSAETVRALYASLQRLAGWRGTGRAEAETPYEYEGDLAGRWPQASAEVQRITEAYVRAHYGQRPFDERELEALRRDWERVRREMEEGDETRDP